MTPTPLTADVPRGFAVVRTARTLPGLDASYRLGFAR
jgi:hypothetical protein